MSELKIRMHVRKLVNIIILTRLLVILIIDGHVIGR